MKKKDLENLYFELLTPFLKEYGFKKKKTNLEFVRNNDLGFDRILLGVTHYKFSSESDVYFLFQKRHNNVQKIVDPLRGTFEHARHESTTTNVHIGTLLNTPEINNNNYRNKIVSEDDIVQDVESFKKLYRDRVESHFEEFSDLTNIMDKYHQKIATAWNYCGPFLWHLYYMTICQILGDYEKLKLMPDEILTHIEKTSPLNDYEDKEKIRKQTEDEVRSFASHLLKLE